ncbi:MAG: efflux RND transporter periplasmic adaptor subunit [Desulfobulbaceae bacterium]|nr:efflux RND transporter periplasmic adaptor subunit [Desulfobulbaceae bacterium]
MKNTKQTLLLMLGVALCSALLSGYYFGWVRHSGSAGEPQTNQAGDRHEVSAKTHYTCSMHPFIIRDEPGNCPICGMVLTPLKVGYPAAPERPAADRKVKHWVSSMDPTYIRQAPGKDNMGMDLVPVYDSGGEPSQIVIDPVTIQNMGVRFAPVERRNLSHTIRTVGLVAYDEPRQYSVNSKIEGWVEKLHVNATGQPVQKGQPLLEIYSPDLVAAQQEYLLALENSRRLANNPYPEIAAGAGRLLEAARTRLSYWDIDAQQIGALTEGGQIRKTMTLYSPNGGVVTMKKVVEGMRVMAGEELLQIADLSRVWVNADLYEHDLPLVRVGQSATVEIPAAPERKLQGRITYIYPYVQNETRTVKARIEFANPGLELKPEMFANVIIATASQGGALVVPGDAVLRSGQGATVFVALGEGRFEPRVVQTGMSDAAGYLQVLSGLKEGEKVVTSAQFLLDSESRLQEVLRKMTAPKPLAAPAAPPENMEGLFK